LPRIVIIIRSRENRSEDHVTLGQVVDQATHKLENPSWWSLLVLLPWTIGVIFFAYQWRVDRDIATREQTTQAVVTTHEPENHDRFGYVFAVNGKIFTGWESPGKRGLEIGRPVLVYYDPVNPKKNALTEFGDRSLGSLGPVPIMLLGIGAGAWYITARRRTFEASSNDARASS
jgi:hypothetical protein